MHNENHFTFLKTGNRFEVNQSLETVEMNMYTPVYDDPYHVATRVMMRHSGVSFPQSEKRHQLYLYEDVQRFDRSNVCGSLVSQSRAQEPNTFDLSSHSSNGHNDTANNHYNKSYEDAPPTYAPPRSHVIPARTFVPHCSVRCPPPPPSPPLCRCHRQQLCSSDSHNTSYTSSCQFAEPHHFVLKEAPGQCFSVIKKYRGVHSVYRQEYRQTSDRGDFQHSEQLLSLQKLYKPCMTNRFIPRTFPIPSHSARRHKILPNSFMNSYHEKTSFPITYGRKNLERDSFYCNVCDKSFLALNHYQRHIEQDHYPCGFPGCGYSAPLAVLDAHKLKHVKGDNVNDILDDPTEIKRWIQARKANFPRQTRESQHKTSSYTFCSIEKLLRQQYLQKKNYGKIRIESSALVPQLPSLLKRERRWTFNDLFKKVPSTHSLRGRSNHYEGFSLKELKEDFPICDHFLKFKTCKWSPCHYSHNISAYRRWKVQRNLRGLDIAMRPPLIYQLLLPEILECEALILLALHYIVKQNFFRNDEDESSHYSATRSSVDEDSDASSHPSLEVLSEASL